MKYSAVIFDFDGTVAETGRGITNCVRYALEKLGRPVPGMDVLKKFVGPPLYESFRNFCGLDHEEAERAVALYRERYTVVGLFECDLYPGFEALVRELNARGAYVAVASGKPEMFLRRIIEHFGMTDCFRAVAGPDPSSHSSDKRGQVLSVLPEGTKIEDACMVGDRCFDIDAGRALGMHTIAVEYGYGNRAEFEASGADEIAATVDQLREMLLG